MPFVRALVSGWQVSGITQFRSGRPIGSILGAVQSARTRARATPISTRLSRDRADQRRLWRRRRAGREPAVVHRSQRVRVGAAPFTYGNTPRTLAFDLRNPSSFNQDLSIQRDFPVGGDVQARARRRGVQRVQHRRLRRHQQQHHERQLRPCELADEYAARDSDQGARRILMKARAAPVVPRRSPWRSRSPSASAQQQPAADTPPPQPEATRPPADNDRTLRPLSPDEIPPNLSFYAMDPLYKPGVPLGWSPTRIRRAARSRPRGVAARGGRVLPVLAAAARAIPTESAFNVYRSTAGERRQRLNAAAGAAHDRLRRYHRRARARDTPGG